MRVLQFLFVSVLSMIVVCYVFHKSILSYMTQQYHIVSDTPFTQTPLFGLANIITSNLESLRITLFEDGAAQINTNSLDKALTQDTAKHTHANTDLMPTNSQNTIDFTHAANLITQNLYTPTLQHNNDETPQSTNATLSKTNITQDSQKASYKSSLDEVKHNGSSLDEVKHNESNPYAHIPKQPRKSSIALPPQTRFLFIGDSLMQGIGMTLPRLLQQHGYKSKNIAKQSTGLTFPSFFDWQKATKQAFLQYPDIGALVVCLGANDPWSMTKIQFGTPEWERIYRQRIQAIFDIAHAHNAQVIWYALPATKNPKLNTKLLYLNTLYEDMTLRNGGVFLSAESILLNGQFSLSIKDEMGKSRQVRAQDGIHLTTYGSRLLAQTLIDSLILPTQNEDTNMHTQDSQTPQKAPQDNTHTSFTQPPQDNLTPNTTDQNTNTHNYHSSTHDTMHQNNSIQILDSQQLQDTHTNMHYTPTTQVYEVNSHNLIYKEQE